MHGIRPDRFTRLLAFPRQGSPWGVSEGVPTTRVVTIELFRSASRTGSRPSYVAEAAARDRRPFRVSMKTSQRRLLDPFERDPASLRLPPAARSLPVSTSRTAPAREPESHPDRRRRPSEGPARWKAAAGPASAIMIETSVHRRRGAGRRTVGNNRLCLSAGCASPPPRTVIPSYPLRRQDRNYVHRAAEHMGGYGVTGFVGCYERLCDIHSASTLDGATAPLITLRCP
jgi:hypothetical protein